MSTIETKRVHGDRSGARRAYVASETGLAAVSISGATVGEFWLVHPEPVQDVAVGPETVVVATAETVHVGTGEAIHSRGPPGDGPLGPATETDFGRARAVGVDPAGRPLAADSDGRVARYAGGWTRLGTVHGTVRALGRDAVAATDGVRPLSALDRPALGDARDLCDPGPFVATANGVYRRSQTGPRESDDPRAWTWRRVREGGADRVATDGNRLAVLAAGTLSLGKEEEWAHPLSAETVRDVAGAGARCYAITETGTVFVEGDRDWRSRSLGLRDVRRLTVA